VLEIGTTFANIRKKIKAKMYTRNWDIKSFTSIVLCYCFLAAYAQPATYPNLFYNNGDLIHVQSGALIHIQGDVENKNGGGSKTITNNGILEVEGNITNEAGAIFERSSGEGVVRMIGGSVVAGVANADHEQKVSGDWATNGKFYNLVIDKENPDTKITMASDVEITGSLVWNGNNTSSATYTAGTAANNVRGATRSGSGIIKLFDGGADNDLYVSNGNANAIAGHQAFTDNGMLNAFADQYILVSGLEPIAIKGLSRSVTQIGLDYDYPLATVLNSYNGLRLNFNAVGGGANKITGTFRDGSVGAISQSCVGCTGAGSLLPDNQGFNYLFNNATSLGCSGGALRQWVILDSFPTTHGIWSFDGNNSNVYVATAYPSSNDLPLGNDNGRLLKLSSAYTASNASMNVDWGASIISSISVINDLLDYTTNLCYVGGGWRGGVYTGFSSFQTAASSSQANALPIKLVYLKAEPINNKFIKVSWQTSLEIDNKGFEVMRSEDAVNFTKIGWIDGNGNSTSLLSYYYDDMDVIANKTYYYRLNQIDFSGTSELTNIVSARINAGDALTVSEFIPNPTIGGTKLIVNSPLNTSLKVKFYSQLGQELFTQEFDLQAGSNDVDFNLSQLANATYTAVMVALDKVYSRKLVIAKN
jgi:hypothetical protein